jgi:CelD/BcsL family acetyltransferase involved in cellulose biosynthesis
MTSFDSARAAQIRRDTWHRRHDRRIEGAGISSMTAVRTPAHLVEMLVSLSRGRIRRAAAWDFFANPGSKPTIEIVIDADSGAILRVSFRTGSPSVADGAPTDPAAITPAA